MATELIQQQGLHQEQTMTHHQIQALEMLFAPAMELSSIISGEIEKNPVLEVEAETYEKIEIEDINNEEINNSDKSETDSNDADEWIEKILQLDSNSKSLPKVQNNSSAENDARRHFLDSLTTPKTLHDHLADQLLYMELSEQQRSCCETIISGLNDDGYLSSHPADLCMVTGESLENLQQAITLVQQLDPPGVGAFNLKERLLLQLDRNGQEESLTYKAIDLYLDDIAANRLPKVAKSLEVTMSELHQIILEIQALKPHLADSLPVKPEEYVEPEVLIVEELGKLKVKIDNERVPTLKISSHYKQMLSDPNLQKETKDYIKSKINGGVFLINSLQQRQSTIRKVTEAITVKQEAFFKEDVNQLKPLTMSEIADDSGVHETTVSRAVAGKYLRCKHGLYPLRFFFTPGYTAKDGTNISNNTVKKAIREIIQGEDSRKPYSDSQLAKMLLEQGLKVARRTVAKYRESLSILPSNLRRTY